MRKIRVAIVHNLPAPYRLPIFEKLLNDEELESKIFFTGRPSGNRPTWGVPSLLKDRIATLPSIGIPVFGKGSDRLYLNAEIGSVFEWNPDVVLLYGYEDPTNILVALCCMRRKLPYAIFSEVSPAWRESRIGSLSRPLVSFIIRRASCLVAASESCVEFFESLGGQPSLIRIIPCLPDVARLISIAESKIKMKGTIRKKYDLVDRFVVLFVGRLVEYKGIEDIFEAMSTIRLGDSDISLLVVGTGPMEEYVRNQCVIHPKDCTYIGGVNDSTLHELFSISDLHIMPSWYEAYGVVCAEALSFGVPSIITSTSGCRDIIDNGRNGLIIEPRNPEQIATAILRLKNDSSLLSRMKAEANSTIRDFTIDNLYERTKTVIKITFDAI